MSIDLKNFAKVDESGKLVLDNDGFTKEFDRAINSACETAIANAEKKLRSSIEKDIRTKIEEEAQLTADQKLEEKIKEFEARQKEFNRREIKQVYSASTLFGEDEIEMLLSTIGDDQEKNLENANRFVTHRKKFVEDQERDFKARMQADLPRNNGGVEGGTVSEAEMYAKKHSQREENIVKL